MDHVQSSRSEGLFVRLDVGATARHAGGHGDGAAAPGLGDDGCLLLVVSGIEHHVRNTRFVKKRRQRL
jgi:hypothetical protein